jgi:hypothetical protein
MSSLTVQTELLASAAADLGGLGSMLRNGNALAAGATTGVSPAAGEMVSALTAAQFAAHAEMYQAVAAQAAAIHDHLVATLGVSVNSYRTTEAANAVATG